MALTDAERIRMTAMALMKYSVIKLGGDSNGIIMGKLSSIWPLEQNTGIIQTLIINTPTKIE